MKKGFTLIEVIISIALITFLLCWQLPIAIKYLKAFNISINESKDSFYVNQAFDFIEMVADDAKAVSVKNNIIELVRKDGTGSDWIRLDPYGNVIISYHQCYYGTVNNVIKDVGSFEALKSGKTILISISTKEGKKYNKCISINIEKAKKDLYYSIHSF